MLGLWIIVLCLVAGNSSSAPAPLADVNIIWNVSARAFIHQYVPVQTWSLGWGSQITTGRYCPRVFAVFPVLIKPVDIRYHRRYPTLIQLLRRRYMLIIFCSLNVNTGVRVKQIRIPPTEWVELRVHGKGGIFGSDMRFILGTLPSRESCNSFKQWSRWPFSSSL